MEKLTLRQIKDHLKSEDQTDRLIAVLSLKNAIKESSLTREEVDTLTDDIVDFSEKWSCRKYIDATDLFGNLTGSKKMISIAPFANLFYIMKGKYFEKQRFSNKEGRAVGLRNAIFDKSYYHIIDPRLYKMKPHKRIFRMLDKIHYCYTEILNNPETYSL